MLFSPERSVGNRPSEKARPACGCAETAFSETSFPRRRARPVKICKGWILTRGGALGREITGDYGVSPIPPRGGAAAERPSEKAASARPKSGFGRAEAAFSETSSPRRRARPLYIRQPAFGVRRPRVRGLRRGGTRFRPVRSGTRPVRRRFRRRRPPPCRCRS